MATITVSRELAAPPERLWPVLQRFDRYHEWLAVHRSFTTPPDFTAGAVFFHHGTLMGLTGELEWTFERVEPTRLLVLSAPTPLNVLLRLSLLLERHGPGTRVTCRYELTGRRIAGLLARAARQEARARTLDSLDRLDRLAREPAG